MAPRKAAPKPPEPREEQAHQIFADLISEIDRWLELKGWKDSRLSLLSTANPRAVERIRSGRATLNTLGSVLDYVRANPLEKRR